MKKYQLYEVYDGETNPNPAIATQKSEDFFKFLKIAFHYYRQSNADAEFVIKIKSRKEQ